MFIGIDTGGTFTDFVVIDQQRVRVHKILSTPQAPDQAILQGLQQLGLLDAVRAGQASVVHGSTVATNAALEHKGVDTAFITNSGHTDMLSIARQQRSKLYALQVEPVAPPVPASHCLGIDARTNANGAQLRNPDVNQIEQLLTQIQHLEVEAVAINLLFSYLQPEHEQLLAQHIQQRFPHIFVTTSATVLTEIKEYERGIATWLNAYLGPIVQRYLGQLADQLQPAPVAVMHSAGGTMNINAASQRAVNLLLSGPAGGLAAAKYYGELCAQQQILSFDMGGTSTDVAMIDGDIKLTREGKIGPFPVAVPMVDMHTIGAGGGSIAFQDAGGLLQLGPESAGARPGPACYGLGGDKPTVTDANLLLGRLGPQPRLGGEMPLDKAAATTVMQKLANQLALSIEQTCLGIIDLANQHMAQALRVISIAQGVDPQQFSLCCFGGAGGLHVCALADELAMSHILIPVYGGVLSAFGMLVAPPQRQRTQTINMAWPEVDIAQLWQQLHKLAKPLTDELHAEFQQASLSQSFALDIQYQGQSFALSIPIQQQHSLDNIEQAFAALHQQRYGHQLQQDLELVNIKVTAQAEREAITLAKWHNHKPISATESQAVYHWQDLACHQRIQGPCVISSDTSTVWVAKAWEAEVDAWGNLELHKKAG